MAKQWDEAEIQSYIDNMIEENLTLDYKAADSLGGSDGKKTEITKDVSAMANSAGGTIIYGVKEYNDPTKKYLPEKLDAVDRIQFPKERLEQVINNIRPHINGVVIHPPVKLSTGSNDVAYVVEIPQSNTAHQAADFRYYKRFNFQSVPMADYEIRDVMNRATTPDVSVEFKYRLERTIGKTRCYVLLPSVTNLGGQVIHNFKLEFLFPRLAAPNGPLNWGRENIIARLTKTNDYIVSYQSRGVLFPNEENHIGDEILWRYEMNEAVYSTGASVSWTLYADNMPPKQGAVQLNEIREFSD